MESRVLVAGYSTYSTGYLGGLAEGCNLLLAIVQRSSKHVWASSLWQDAMLGGRMGKALVHDDLQVTTPATFVEMSSDEMNQAFQDNNSNRWGARDVRNHTMIVIAWQDSSKLLAKLVSTNSLIKRVEKLSAKGYANNEYELEGFFKRTLCGVEAEGFNFSYKVQDVQQRAQNIVLKHGKTCYTIYWIERKGSSKSAERALDFILDSLAFAEA